jgi:hypothetical protein
MKVPAYPRTKPSGVELLGDVPEHWEVKRPAPTGLRPKAQGWTEERGPTLGNERPIGSSTPTGLWPVAAMRGGVTQPRWGWGHFATVTQGSACRATLGWRTESRWDSRNGGEA